MIGWSKARAASVMLMLMLMPAAAADSPLDCAKIDDDQQRLNCYDRIYRTTTTTAAPAASNGRWVVVSDTSKIDDSVNVMMVATALKPVVNRYGHTEDAQLYILCRENTTDLSVFFGGEHMADLGSYGEVTTRIDKQKAVTKRWVESTDNKHLGLWGGGRSIPFIKTLFGGKVLLVQATPYSENTLTLEFPIEGIENAIIPLREACNWAD